ncbi:MAG: hypothetical protein M1829_001288 [Trizodia sp. TS-e1964]|nr:MAG: hypothetical protein M1829_001288 [Trizodia sp. TS-e1964]
MANTSLFDSTDPLSPSTSAPPAGIPLSEQMLPPAPPLPLPPPSYSRLSPDTLYEMLASLRSVVQAANQLDGAIDPLPDNAPGAHGEDGLEVLTAVRKSLDQLWWSSSPLLLAAAEVLADASREVRWRKPFGDAGILQFFLALISTQGVAGDLMLHSLRLVGNSCADTDENRARILSSNYIVSIINQLRNPEILHITVPVLFNVCVDYEPAQLQAASANLSHELLRLLLSDRHRNLDFQATLAYILQLIELIVSLPNGTSNSPDNALSVLFKVASKPEINLENYLASVNLAMAHLADPRFQKHLLSQKMLEIPLSIVEKSFSRYSPQDISGELSSASIKSLGGTLPEDVASLISQMRSSLIQTLSEISALPEFPLKYSMNSTLVKSLRSFLDQPQAQLQTCACIMLGNLARSDDPCRIMIHRFGIHKSLITLLKESNDSQALHAAAGYLKNLSLLIDNKNTIGRAGLIEVICRLWSMDASPQIQYAGVSLARQVISGSPENIQCLLSSLSPDPDSPANTRTYLSLLLSLYEKSDHLPTRTEIARTITAIFRALNSPFPKEAVAETQFRLFSLHQDVGRPLATMVCQDKWPVVRSEGWFAFALMARTIEGAACVNHALYDFEAFRLLIETVTQRKVIPGRELDDFSLASPGVTEPELAEESTEATKGREMKRIDRENALVLVSELLKNWGEHPDVVRKKVFEDLLHGRAAENMT